MKRPAPRICCACGMRHWPGNCAYLQHMDEGYVAMRNELDALKKQLRKRRRA